MLVLQPHTDSPESMMREQEAFWNIEAKNHTRMTRKLDENMLISYRIILNQCGNDTRAWVEYLNS